MITHKAFAEQLNRVLTKAVLEKENGFPSVALGSLEYAIMHIDIHSRNTVTKPPQLLKIEREIFREAFNLAKTILSPV
jgi:hypothetical protein